jgi:hypothetical protein
LKLPQQIPNMPTRPVHQGAVRQRDPHVCAGRLMREVGPETDLGFR